VRKRVIVAATALSLLGLLGPGAAGAAPAPLYAVTCVDGGLTTASWKRVRVSEVSFEWLAPAGSATVFDPVAVQAPSKGRHGSVFSTTAASAVVQPVSVTATFTRADGTTDRIEAACG
jgi:hypothetical protein